MLQNLVINPGSSGGAVSSVSNSDGSLTISPTTGVVIASVNQGADFTWTGTHEFPVTGFIMQASDGSRWYVTIDSSGTLVTTVIASGGVGSPMGLLLSITYAA